MEATTNRMSRTKKSTNRKRKSKAKQVIVSEKVTAPAASSAIVVRNTRGPRINTIGNTVVVCNTEVVATIISGAAGVFTEVGIGLYPGNFTSWLNGVAVNYSKWRWRKLRLVYIPTVPTTTAGLIVMGLTYDFADTAPTTVTQLQTFNQSVTAPVWGGYDGTSSLHNYSKSHPGAVLIDVDVTRFGSGNGLTWYKYLNATNFAAQTGIDRNIYAPGALAVATSGGTNVAAAAVGNIFASYEIELIEPTASATNQ